MKKINNLKLLVFLGFVASCTPNISSITPSVKPTTTAATKPSGSSNPNIPTSPVITIKPENPVSTSSPSSTIDFKNLKVKEIRIYDGDNIITNKNFETQEVNRVLYNMTTGEIKKFSAELIYENGLINKNVKWKSNDSSIVSVDDSGLIKSESVHGKTFISVYDGINSLEIQINNLPTLDITRTEIVDCKPTEVTRERQRFEYIYNNTFGETGTTGDPNLYCRTMFSGKVYDIYNNIIDGVTVKAKSIDPIKYWESDPQITNGGYVIRNAPVKVKIEITASKEGWLSKTRIEILELNLQGNPKVNVFDFNGIYALQKIN